MWPFERRTKITPGSRTVPGYAGPCGVGTLETNPDYPYPRNYMEDMIGDILLSGIQREREIRNRERRARYRKTMRSRRPAVR